MGRIQYKIIKNQEGSGVDIFDISKNEEIAVINENLQTRFIWYCSSRRKLKKLNLIDENEVLDKDWSKDKNKEVLKKELELLLN